MSKYSEDESYLEYLEQQSNNKKNNVKNTIQKPESSNSNKDYRNKDDKASKLDNMMTKIENIEIILNDIYTHLGLRSSIASGSKQ